MSSTVEAKGDGREGTVNQTDAALPEGRGMNTTLEPHSSDFLFIFSALFVAALVHTEPEIMALLQVGCRDSLLWAVTLILWEVQIYPKKLSQPVHPTWMKAPIPTGQPITSLPILSRALGLQNLQRQNQS